VNKSSLPQSVGLVAQPVPPVQVVQSGQPATAPATKIRLSFNQLTTLRWSLLEELLQLRTSRYDAIGLWRPKIAAVGERLAAGLIREAGLSVSSLSFAGGFTGIGGVSYEDAVADTRDAIVDAETLGAENLILVSGAQNGHTVRHSRRLLIYALTELADFAGARGVRLCVLPMHQFFAKTWTYLNTLNETLELLSRVNHPSVGLAFDTYHLWQEPGLVERIPEFAATTGIVQISDAHRVPQSAAERCIPGDGSIPLEEIVRAFQGAGFDGYYDVQVWSRSGWSGDYPVTALRCRQAVLRIASHAVASTR
jgi:sugar phosphate isomerase/epimerase